jgi:hypothetical protein
VECLVVDEAFQCKAYPINSKGIDVFSAKNDEEFGFDLFTRLNDKVIFARSYETHRPVVFLPSGGIGANTMSFTSPIVLTSAFNFDGNFSMKSITFVGGAIDFICKKRGILYPDETIPLKQDKNNTEIEKSYTTFVKVGILNDSPDFTYRINITDQEANLNLGLNSNISFYPNYSLNVNSILSIHFDSPQTISSYKDISKFYISINDFMSFLIGQRNLHYDKLTINCDGVDFDVEFNSMYDKPCIKEQLDCTVIRINQINNYLPHIFELFFNEETSPWLQFLPDRNEYVGHISGQTIVDLIIAIEKESSLNELIDNSKGDTATVKNLGLD